jgi:hypothetical protein
MAVLGYRWGGSCPNDDDDDDWSNQWSKNYPYTVGYE